MIFSTPQELAKIKAILSKYTMLPFSGDTIPGAVMESVLGNVRNAQVLNTYDFVDVVSSATKCGWQVKSTKESTPVTWKRAKIPNARSLIDASRKSDKGLQNLGDAIIDFCNHHAKESLDLYGLDEIGYARLIVHPNKKVTYFEKILCTRRKPNLFNPEDFEWQWSTPKKTVKKEQLPALHGRNRTTGKKWWAWHGLGENQLHFSGEDSWWPEANDPQAIAFNFPSEEEKLSLEGFIDLLASLDKDS
ncbi:MAG: hypothetical protein HYS17_02800 [Micavibrio aeruginosavorus]|uniref:Uncharacterized protein n=1 Tax=Micavibrio aeruginosavorus TaxID=349221 RepID=A0A7T5UH91_9BACT|nr:MAG: hypothetical protein HYS17_02800 [Micavibrio aeruginosavorus]